MKAIGIHVFAGGFSMGVKEVMPVECQLEVHGFGTESAEQVAGVPVINAKFEKWPKLKAEFAFGNPRCTGFSTITSGYGEDTHGAFAKQTCDIQELCKYSAGKFDIVVWESVQQATTVGRPLIDWAIKDCFKPKKYRIAHVFINAASFGNVQQRKRYFFVAYRNDKQFNIMPPTISPWKPMLYDAIYSLRNRESNEVKANSIDYNFDSHLEITPDEKATLPHLPNGWDVNTLARYHYDVLPQRWKDVWDFRASDMPFSLHCMHRANWLRPSATMHSGAGRIVHPDLDRPLTIGELSRIMGWPDIPRGKMPIPQLAKGIVPAVGTWLAEQAKLYLDGFWGNEDWESVYNPFNCEWEGDNANGTLEKTFDMTQFIGHQFDIERYPHDLRTQSHRFDVAYSAKRTARGSKN
jgi:site-specific DNA-cytosine methylase